MNCPNCGVENERDAEFCFLCGEPLDPDKYQEQDRGQQPEQDDFDFDDEYDLREKPRFGIILAAVAVIIILAVIATVIVIKGKHENTERLNQSISSIIETLESDTSEEETEDTSEKETEDSTEEDTSDSETESESSTADSTNQTTRAQTTTSRQYTTRAQTTRSQATTSAAPTTTSPSTTQQTTTAATTTEKIDVIEPDSDPQTTTQNVTEPKTSSSGTEPVVTYSPSGEGEDIG